MVIDMSIHHVIRNYKNDMILERIDLNILLEFNSLQWIHYYPYKKTIGKLGIIDH